MRVRLPLAAARSFANGKQSLAGDDSSPFPHFLASVLSFSLPPPVSSSRIFRGESVAVRRFLLCGRPALEPKEHSQR